MPGVDDLFALQEIDLSLDALRASVAANEEALGETEELIAARELLQQRADALHVAQRRQRELEAQVQALDEKIGPLERKLYGGTIGSPKELADLQQDIESIKRRRGALEDETLDAMAASDQTQADLNEARAALETLEAEWRASQTGHREELASLRKQITAAEAERQRRLAGVDPDHLALYETLRRTRGGRAVARIERNVCGGCRISLPVSVQQRIRSAVSMVRCPSCERILYNG